MRSYTSVCGRSPRKLSNTGSISRLTRAPHTARRIPGPSVPYVSRRVLLGRPAPPPRPPQRFWTLCRAWPAGFSPVSTPAASYAALDRDATGTAVGARVTTRRTAPEGTTGGNSGCL